MRQFFVKSSILLVILVCVWGFSLYANTLHNPFVFDDLPFIVHNRDIKDLSNIVAIWNTRGVPARFISFLSFAVNYHFHQLDVTGYHLVNIAVHIINAILVYWLMVLTFKTPRMRKEDVFDPTIVSAAVALLFLVHPVQTQAVTYITQRFASLATLFYLLSVCAYVQARLNGRRIFFLFSVAAAVAAMFTKEIALTLPFAILLYEFCFFKRKEGRFSWYWLFFLALFLIIPAVYSFKTSLLDLTARSGSFLGEPLDRNIYLLTQFRVLCTYLKLLFYPLNQNLLYEFVASRNFFEIKTFLSFLVLFCLFIFALFIRRRRPLIAFGIFWFFLTLSVESSIIVIRHVIFEHRLYLPSVGFFMAFAVGIHGLIRNRTVFIAFLSILVLGLSYLTIERNKVWQSPISLWQDVVNKSPRLIKAKLNLGVAYTEAEDYITAIKIYTELINDQPNAEAFGHRGNVYNKLGEYPLAVSDYTKAIAILPDSAQMYTGRADAFFYMGKYKEALLDYTKAIEVNPDYLLVYAHRGNLYRVLKKYVLAKRDYNEAIARDPYMVDPYMGIGAISFMQREYNTALDYFTHVLNLDKENVSALINRANTYSELNQPDLALNDYERAISLNSTNGQIYYNRAILFQKMKQNERAEADFAKAKALGYEPK